MGDVKVFGLGSTSPGPYHFENATVQTIPALWFAGGAGSDSVGVTPTGTLRRVWLQTPPSWLWSEPSCGRYAGWQVTIGNSSTGAARGGVGNASPWPGPYGWGPAMYGPARGGIMYELATGIARRCLLSDPPGMDILWSFDLVDPWPTQPSGTITVGFQKTTTDIESSPLVYNSGLETPMPTATVNTSTRHVVLSAELSTDIKAEVDAGHTLYFYLNNTVWAGDLQGAGPGSSPWTQPANANGWGFHQSVTRAQCLRKKIVSVDSNRLGFTFDATQDLFTSAQITAMGAATFPYSIVRFDGLWRGAFEHYKGSWENKTAKRWLIEGCVFEHTTNRCYPASALASVGCVRGLGTISGNLFTWNSTTWPYDQLQSNMRLYGGTSAPDLYPTICLDPGNEYYSYGRIIKRYIGTNQAELLPIDPRFATWQLGDGVWNVLYVGVYTPWVTIYGQVQRFNVFNKGTLPYFVTESVYSGKSIRGGQVSFHDNLCLRLGDRSWPDAVGTPALGITVPQDAPFGGPVYVYAPDGAAVYDDPPSTGIQGHWRYDHNTVVRSETIVARSAAALHTGLSPTNSTVRATAISVSNNLVTDANGAGVAPMSAYYGGYPAVPSTDTSWDPDSSVVKGNVLHGTGGLASAYTLWNHAQENACVTDITAVGLPNYANGATDGFNLANYALGDIFTTGTVQIDPAGTTVTLESGTFPATVVAGQFFLTRSSGQAVRINQILMPSLGASWSAYAGFGVFTKAGGVAYPAGPASRTVMTHTQALGNDQWAQVTLVSGTTSGGSLLIRWAAPDMMSGYLVGFSVGAPMKLWRCDAGAFTGPYATGSGTVAANDVLLVDATGTTITGYRNGTLQFTYPSATQYGSGRAGLDVYLGDATTIFDDFSCGNHGSGAAASDAFTGGGITQFQLATPYPEVNVSGKSYAITFKNSATDGTDPGADLTTLALMTAGVRDPARAYD